MCGIAGLLTWTDEAARERIEHMTASLVHRGPDDSGFVSHDGVYLGHRRLTVIDLSPNGRQPMSNEDGNVWITYNGELYGTDSLRQGLEAKGHQFRSRTDTEVLVHLYEEEGRNLFHRVNGMFAFAIHDRGRNRLLVARDRLGIKPLFYTVQHNEFLFASELKAIIAGIGGSPSYRPESLGQYLLQGYVSSPDTLFEGIRVLPPGHFLELDLEELKRGCIREPIEYWDAAFTGVDDRAEDQIESDLETLLADAVRIRMVADVPLGAFLSGGIDSSSVVALMARASSSPIRTFTVDIPGTTRSERDKARAVATKYGTHHTEIDTTESGAEEYWERLSHFDSPFNCSSLLNAWLVSRAARKHVTVALSGDGGDELFGGYERYLEFDGRRPLPAGKSLIRAAGSLIPHTVRGRARLMNFASDDFYNAFTARHPIPVDLAERVVGVSLSSWTERMRAIYERYESDRLNRAMYLDLKTYLADHILAKVDSASMAVSLEVRVPFLDYRVVELAGRIPASLKVKNGEGKWILKRMARRLLPEGLVDQPKVGFDPPLAAWIFDAEIESRLQELSDPEALYRNVLDGGEIDRWIGDMKASSRWRVLQRAALWSIYQLERWMQLQGGEQGSPRIIESELAASAMTADNPE